MTREHLPRLCIQRCRSGVSLVMKMRVQPYSFLACSPAKPTEENDRGSHDDMLPQSDVPRQKTGRQGQYPHPCASGSVVALYTVPQDVHRHERHGVLPPANASRHGHPPADAPRRWLAAASYRLGLGFDERTVSAWRAWAGVQSWAVQAHLGEQPHDFGQMHATVNLWMKVAVS